MKSLQFSINFLLGLARTGFEGMGYSIYECRKFILGGCPYADIFLFLPTLQEINPIINNNISNDEIAIINALKRNYNIPIEREFNLNTLIKKLRFMKPNNNYLEFVKNNIVTLEFNNDILQMLSNLFL